MSLFRPTIRFLSALLTLSLPLGCGGGEVEADVRVLDPWARAMAVEAGEAGPLTQANSAVYMRIRNLGSIPDRLVGGETPVAGAVEVHESSLEGDVMRMREVGASDIPGKGEVELSPGGLHIMLLDLRQSLKLGDTISLTLTFQESGPMEVRVPIQVMGRT